MEYQVTVYVGDNTFDQFKTGTLDNAKRQGEQVAKWARYYHPAHNVMVKIKEIS